MKTYLNIAEIITAVFLIAAVLLQARGGALGGVFGQWGQSTFRTRRGIERTLFRLTIVLVAIFIVISILSVRVGV